MTTVGQDGWSSVTDLKTRPSKYEPDLSGTLLRHSLQGRQRIVAVRNIKL